MRDQPPETSGDSLRSISSSASRLRKNSSVRPHPRALIAATGGRRRRQRPEGANAPHADASPGGDARRPAATGRAPNYQPPRCLGHIPTGFARGYVSGLDPTAWGPTRPSGKAGQFIDLEEQEQGQKRGSWRPRSNRVRSKCPGALVPRERSRQLHNLERQLHNQSGQKGIVFCL